MRKVLSFVLVLSLVLASFGFAFAAPADVQGTDYETPVEVLMALGIVDGYPDGTYKPENTVTRAEMAKLLIVALGLDNLTGGSKSSYSDMAGHWADSYVALATAKGVILGYPDGTFKPDSTVSFNEAITMVVRSLGYNDQYVTETSGAWPVGYLVIAQDEDITDKADATSTRGNIAQLLYNALSADTVRMTRSTDGQYTLVYGDALIEKVGATSTAAFAVTADDVYDKDFTQADLSDYVYAIVTAFTIKDDNDNDVIIAVDEVESESATLKYDADVDTLVDANNKVWNTVIPPTTKLFLNGYETTWASVLAPNNEYLKNLMVTVYADKVSTGSRTFTNIKGIIADAPTFGARVTADEVDEIEDTLEDQDGDVLGVTLPMRSGKLNMDRIIVTGDADSLEDIAVNDIVYVYTAANSAGALNLADPKIVRFDVKKGDTVTGEITKLDGPFVYIDDVRYGKAESWLLDSYPTTAVGDDITAYMGTDGKIVDAKVNEATTGKYAIVVNATNDTDVFGATTAKIKIYTYEDEELTLDCDEFSTTDYEVTTAGWTAAKTPGAGDLVEFALNSSNELDTMKKVAGQTTITAAEFIKKSNILGAKEIASNVVIFDAMNLADVDIVNALTDEATYTAKVATNPDGEYKVVAITAATGHDASDTVYFAVNAAADVKNSDGDVVKEITGFADGAEAVDLTDGTPVMAKGNLYAVQYGDGAITSASAITASVGRTVSAVASNDSYVELSNGTKYTLADELAVYVKDIKLNGAFSKYTLGSMDDVGRADYVYLYEVTETDSENKGYDILVVVDKSEEYIDSIPNI